MALWPEPLTRAYAACEALARSHYENFPVASQLLPAPMRPHVAAVYAFARVADDIADEGSAPASDRLAQLNAWRRRLHAAVTVESAEGAPHEHEDLIVAALAHSIRSLDLPMALFDDLVSAFGQDTMTTRYASWSDVFDYCRRSANPVGRLVLRIAGHRDEALDRSSDALCTALQLANFWQDFGRQCVAVTREQFAAGRAVCDGVRGRLRYELRLTWLGGQRILERVDRARRELLTYRPTLGGGDVPVILWRALRWSAHV
ncbi:MAG: squalene synthase HpnC [Acidobacteria bacterium]|nr:MAG: squalene synthase HpnC [Acidobacteriota bacterium]